MPPFLGNLDRTFGGVDCPAFALQAGQKALARVALGLEDGETAFLFSGRLSFHAKATSKKSGDRLQSDWTSQNCRGVR